MFNKLVVIACGKEVESLMIEEKKYEYTAISVLFFDKTLVDFVDSED